MNCTLRDIFILGVLLDITLITLQADSFPSEPSGKPKDAGVGSLSLLQGIFMTQKSNWGLGIVGGFFTSWDTREA